MNYQNNINLKYLMGGLLPSWDNFNRGGIQKPEDVFVHWRDVYEESKMAIDGSVWLDEPIQSSYPPSIAFKAAQMQNIDKAIIFLRRMNEIVFLESKNISNINIIKKASFDAGLDIARLLRDMESKALHIFYDDLDYAKELRVEILPTFVFTVSGEVKEYLYGAQTYDAFEKTILKHHPTIKKSLAKNSPKDLFKAFPVLTMHEFQFLTASDFADANQMINELLSYGTIKKVPTKLGLSYYAMAG
jgi:predicted DsbA family dithiol-disulfide isomerase